MKLSQAIIQSFKVAKKKHGIDQATYHMAIYRKGLEKYPFQYIPEFTVITRPFDPKDSSTWTSGDVNCWRYGCGSFSEMIIPERWIDKEDWEVYQEGD